MFDGGFGSSVVLKIVFVAVAVSFTIYLLQSIILPMLRGAGIGTAKNAPERAAELQNQRAASHRKDRNSEAEGKRRRQDLHFSVSKVGEIGNTVTLLLGNKGGIAADVQVAETSGEYAADFGPKILNPGDEAQLTFRDVPEGVAKLGVTLKYVDWTGGPKKISFEYDVDTHSLTELV